MQWKLRSRRTPSGKLLRKNTKKKKYMRGRDFLPMHIGSQNTKKNRTRGGGTKLILLSSDTANIVHEGRSKKVKILAVVKNPADAQFVRHNVITKGAIIQTELGEALVTSRPGQDGVVNAVLVQEKSSEKK